MAQFQGRRQSENVRDYRAPTTEQRIINRHLLEPLQQGIDQDPAFWAEQRTSPAAIARYEALFGKGSYERFVNSLPFVPEALMNRPPDDLEELDPADQPPDMVRSNFADIPQATTGTYSPPDLAGAMAGGEQLSPKVVQTIIAESLGEGPEGMRLVAETIVNRARERGITPEQVVMERGQYAPHSPQYKAGSAIDLDSPDNIAAATAAWGAAQSAEDPTLGAEYFSVTGTKAPTATERLQPVWEHGGHTFWNDTSGVKVMQQNLAAAGLYNGEIDGDFGPATKAAADAYRAQLGTEDPMQALTSLGAEPAAGQEAIQNILQSPESLPAFGGGDNIQLAGASTEAPTQPASGQVEIDMGSQQPAPPTDGLSSMERIMQQAQQQTVPTPAAPEADYNDILDNGATPQPGQPDRLDLTSVTSTPTSVPGSYSEQLREQTALNEAAALRGYGPSEVPNAPAPPPDMAGDYADFETTRANVQSPQTLRDMMGQAGLDDSQWNAGALGLPQAPQSPDLPPLMQQQYEQEALRDWARPQAPAPVTPQSPLGDPRLEQMQEQQGRTFAPYNAEAEAAAAQATHQRLLDEGLDPQAAWNEMQRELGTIAGTQPIGPPESRNYRIGEGEGLMPAPLQSIALGGPDAPPTMGAIQQSVDPQATAEMAGRMAGGISAEDAARELQSQQAFSGLQGPWSSVFAAPEAEQQPGFRVGWPNDPAAPAPAGQEPAPPMSISEFNAMFEGAQTPERTQAVLDRVNARNAAAAAPAAATAPATAATASLTPTSSGPGVVRYMNQDQTRNQPLSPETEQRFQYISQQTGLEVHVVSGGQPSSGPGRVGAHRHDEGHAGDVSFFDPAAGRYLDMANEADVPRMQEAVRLGVSAGLTNLGAEPGYMTTERVHMGDRGTPATWGEGEVGDAAPWAEQAYAEGMANPLTPEQLTAALAAPATTATTAASTQGINLSNVGGIDEDTRTSLTNMAVAAQAAGVTNLDFTGDSVVGYLEDGSAWTPETQATVAAAGGPRVTAQPGQTAVSIAPTAPAAPAATLHDVAMAARGSGVDFISVDPATNRMTGFDDKQPWTPEQQAQITAAVPGVVADAGGALSLPSAAPAPALAYAPEQQVASAAEARVGPVVTPAPAPAPAPTPAPAAVETAAPPNMAPTQPSSPYGGVGGMFDPNAVAPPSPIAPEPAAAAPATPPVVGATAPAPGTEPAPNMGSLDPMIADAVQAAQGPIGPTNAGVLEGPGGEFTPQTMAIEPTPVTTVAVDAPNQYAPAEFQPPVQEFAPPPPMAPTAPAVTETPAEQPAAAPGLVEQVTQAVQDVQKVWEQAAPSTADLKKSATQAVKDKYLSNPIERAAKLATGPDGKFDHDSFWDNLGDVDLTQTQQAQASRVAAQGHFTVNKMPNFLSGLGLGGGDMPQMSNVVQPVQNAVSGIGNFFGGIFGGNQSAPGGIGSDYAASQNYGGYVGQQGPPGSSGNYAGSYSGPGAYSGGNGGQYGSGYGGGGGYTGAGTYGGVGGSNINQGIGGAFRNR